MGSLLGEIGNVKVRTQNEVTLKIDYLSLAIGVIIIISGAIVFLVIKKLV